MGEDEPVYRCRNCTSTVKFATAFGWFCPQCRQTYRVDELVSLKLIPALAKPEKGEPERSFADLVTFTDDYHAHAMGVALDMKDLKK